MNGTSPCPFPAVSYTHLDVYKRQVVDLPGRADGRSIAASLVSFEIEMASGGALDGDAALVSLSLIHI